MPLNISSRYGDGRDGDVTISSNTTLTTNMQYQNLTVNVGVTLTTGGYNVYVRDTLLLNGNISRDGNNGAVGTAGTGLASTVTTGSGAGGAGGATGAGATATAQSNSIGASGGNGGAGTGGSGGGGGGATALPAASGGTQIINSGVSAWNPLFINTSSRYNASAGGGGGGGVAVGASQGGGGGGGAGHVRVYARRIFGAGLITARGGNGGSVVTSGYGGGGGGGGGSAVVCCDEFGSGFSVSNIIVDGGTGGNGGGGGGLNGSNGSAGNRSILVGLDQQMFGAGTDGDVTISVDTTLSRDMYYRNLTINSGIVLTTAGYRIFVLEKLTLNGTISRRGTDASGSTGAAGLSFSVFGLSGAGGNGLSGVGATGTSVSPGVGGAAGTGGSSDLFVGGNPGSLSTPAESGGGVRVFKAAPACYSPLQLGSNTRLGGAPGGGGGAGDGANSGGGGGSGGAILALYANRIEGFGTLTARGGNGGAGALDSCGGGGGGGGGVIILVTSNDVNNLPITVNVSGGIGGQPGSGSGGGGGLPGQNGSAGRTYLLSTRY